MVFITHEKKRFEQPSFVFFSDVDELLLKSINVKSYHKEYDNFISVYTDDFETTALPSDLLIFRTMFECVEPVQFGDIVEKLKTVSAKKRSTINIVNNVSPFLT